MNQTTTIDIPSSVLAEAKKFRLAKTPPGGLAALVFKIDKKELRLDVEERLQGSSIEDVVDELPENSPRFVVVSCVLKHRDGRVSYSQPSNSPTPLGAGPSLSVLEFDRLTPSWAPTTSSMELSTLYASALSNFSVQIDVAKIVDVRDGEISQQALQERLGA